MKEWICEEVPALTLDGKVIDTMLLMKKELVRCKDCAKKGSYLCRLDRDLEEYGSRRTDEYDDWFCADGEKEGGKET